MRMLRVVPCRGAGVRSACSARARDALWQVRANYVRNVIVGGLLTSLTVPCTETYPQMIVLKIANLQALAKQPATPSIGQNYTPADSRTPLLALRTCPPSSFWGFLEINFFEFFHSTMLKYGQSHTCAGKLAPPRRLLSYFYSNTTPKATELSLVLTLTRKSSGDHLSLQTTSFSLRHQ